MKYKLKALNRLARKIIRGNEYTTLATTDRRGIPWVAIVAYAYDKDWNLYFVSIPRSKHGKLIALNRHVACTVFDSRQAWGHGVGLQVEAKCRIILKKEMATALKSYFGRKYPFGSVEPEIKNFFLPDIKNPSGLYKFYKVIPKAVWINDPYSETDRRVKVNLKG